MARSGAPKLTEQQKRFIIIRLAECMSLAEVMADFKERWPNVEITKQGVQGYDPTTVQGRDLSKKHRLLFEARRRKYVQAVVDEPLVHQRGRLRKWAQQVDELDEQVDAAKKMGAHGNPRLVAELIKLQSEIVERISKEVGGVFTNRYRHEGRAVDVLAQMLGMSPEELERAE